MFELGNRLRLLITALILVPILLYWGFAHTPQEASSEITPLTGKIDYYIDHVKSREWDSSGALKRSMTSERIEHDPQSELNYLTLPKSLSFRSNSSHMQITAEEGIALDDNSRTDLAGNVIVLDNPSSDSGTTLITEQLSIYPKKDFAATDKPVTISSTHGKISGTGMDLHFEKQILNLHSDVKGIYHDAD
ncbi:MAG: LPS export ABC transporter periplasmic protein LptC [Neptuniibacter sp.]